MGSRLALVAATGAMDLDTDGPHLFPALAWAGVDWEVVAWDDPSARWSSYDLVVLRACWDYFTRIDEFRSVLAHIGEVSTLVNPLEVVEWNLDKRYLLELEQAGLPVIETAFVAHLLPPTELGAGLGRVHRWGADEIVVKPTVSAGSNDTFRLAGDDGASIARAVQTIIASDRVAMIQPYLPDVDTDGERGCVYVDGVFDHAFTKGALLHPGAQEVDGLFVAETIDPADATEVERQIADRVMAWVSDRFGPLLYGRVDLLPAASGPRVVEVELIEPSMFFEVDPPSARRFVEAIRRRL